MREQQLLRLFESRYGKIPAYGREILEKLMQRSPCFQVIDERLERNAGTRKKRSCRSGFLSRCERQPAP